MNVSRMTTAKPHACNAMRRCSLAVLSRVNIMNNGRLPMGSIMIHSGTTMARNSGNVMTTSEGPGPVANVGMIHPVAVGVVDAVDAQVAQLLLDVCALHLQTGHAIDHVDGETEAVDPVLDGEFERRVDTAALHVAADMQVAMVGTAVSEPVDKPRIAVEIEQDRLVDGEQAVEIAVAQSVRVPPLGTQAEQVHNIDEANPEVGKMLPQQGVGRQRFLGGEDRKSTRLNSS